MSAPLDHYTNLLRYWRSVETFSLPDIPFRKTDAVYTRLQPGRTLPWETVEPTEADPAATFPRPAQADPAATFPRPTAGRRWKHTLYFHLVPKETVITLLAKLTGSTEYREPVTGETCLSALVLDQSGRPGVRSYAPAAFAFAIKLLREKHDPEELTEELKHARERYSVYEEPAPLTWPLLQKELAHLRALTDLPNPTPILCISEQVHPAAPLDAPFLNSHYIQDLDTLIRHPHQLGAGLQKLLTPTVDTDSRQNLLDPQILSTHLHPRDLPPGRWPSNPAHGLYTAQLAALQITLTTLRTDDAAGTPLLGINGPPGTGKTTLLREVIANIIVARAKRLLNANPENLFTGRRIAIHDKAGYHPIDESIFGKDGIVVAGSNNIAIENISRELPQLKSIDLAAFPETDYFSGIATHLAGEPAWGMISAVLGRSDNRSTFIDKFWFNKGRNFNKYLRELAGEEDQARTHFAQTAAELTGLLKEYEIATASLPGPDFENLPMETIHSMTPHSSQKLNTLRSNIFLRSLELHEWAIRANPAYFQTNLSAFVDMLTGKYREQLTEEIAAILWNTFFFCIPVVSVTLASFHRQFGPLGQGALGWLLLDEAGQATLPSIAGALWRAQRSVLIGDTRQIAPVIGIPRALDKLLQERYKLTAHWSPLDHSAQSLADRITPTGSWLDDPAGSAGSANRTWTGIPLRAHHRCDEPMFSIANAIAYNNQMVRVNRTGVADSRSGSPSNPSVAGGSLLPPSAWHDIRGFTILEGHALREELEAVKDLLQRLAAHEGEVFIISPFRTVAGICYKSFQKKGRIECGTIHTFQGREADVVLLVLGTAQHSKKARSWVAATPNILNVAITRARRRLYVIGNRQTWGALPYFDYLAKSLPPPQLLTQSP
jgi:AAA domain